MTPIPFWRATVTYEGEVEPFQIVHTHDTVVELMDKLQDGPPERSILMITIKRNKGLI